VTHRGPFQPRPFCDSVKLFFIVKNKNISLHLWRTQAVDSLKVFIYVVLKITLKNKAPFCFFLSVCLFYAVSAVSSTEISLGMPGRKSSFMEPKLRSWCINLGSCCWEWMDELKPASFCCTQLFLSLCGGNLQVRV